MRLGYFVAAAVVMGALAAPATAFNQKDNADCIQTGDIDRVIAGCTRLLKSGDLTTQQRAIAHGKRGGALKNKGESERALADLKEAIRLNPEDVVSYNIRGNLWQARGDFDRAIADFNEAIRHKPEWVIPYISRGEAWHFKGEPDRAITDFNEAIRLKPDFANAYGARAGAWYEKGDFDHAIADLNECIRLDPKSAIAYSNRALIWRDKRDFDRALADDNEAIRLNPKYVQAYANRGEIWRLKGDLDLALDDENFAIKLNPNVDLPYILRGDTLRYKGELNRALADYDQALRLVPNVIAAFTGRGLTYEKMGNLPRARAEFEKALASPSQHRSDITRSALETARSRLAAIDSGAVQPVIPAAPSKVVSATSIPTPTAVIPAATPAPAPTQGRRIALVIGNSAYKNVAALPNPQRDAAAIAASLRAIGFQAVTLVSDATREKLIDTLRAFADEADKADWAVVYYAGHGMEASGINYLIPVDAKLATDRDATFEAVPLDQLMVSVEGAKKLKLVLLDACRDNPFAPQMRQSAPAPVAAPRSAAGNTIGTRSIGRGLGEVKVTGATLVVYAAKHGQVALDGDGGNSPFAVALVQRLATPGVEINKLFRLVRDDVMEATAGRQEPFTYGSLPGREDFYFVAK